MQDGFRIPFARIVALVVLSGCASSRPSASDPAGGTAAEANGSISGIGAAGAFQGVVGMYAPSPASQPFTAGMVCVAVTSDMDAGTASPPEKLTCPMRSADSNFGTDDPDFGTAYQRAKAACDRAFSWQCGEMFVAFEAVGCAVSFSKRSGTDDELPAGYAGCVIEQLAWRCSRCERNTMRRFFESCTLL